MKHKNNDSSFWAGLGAGSVLGATIYAIACTARARRLEKKVGDALGKVAHRTGHVLNVAEKHVLHAGSKVVDATARMTDNVAAKVDHVAEHADRMAGKADNVKAKWDNMTAQAEHR